MVNPLEERAEGALYRARLQPLYRSGNVHHDGAVETPRAELTCRSDAPVEHVLVGRALRGVLMPPLVRHRDQIDVTAVVPVAALGFAEPIERRVVLEIGPHVGDLADRDVLAGREALHR